MIPLIDAYLKDLINRKIDFLKENPVLIDQIFGTLGTRSTLKSFREFVVKRDIKTLIGFPREAQQLPCFVIMVAGEQEIPLGLGDNTDAYENPDREEWDDDNLLTQYVIDGTDMKSTYRVECWSDNGDLTAYMYTLLKWCLLSGRRDMLKSGFVLPTLSGTDLEPVPDYIPVFVYRRSLMVTFQYENKFFDEETKRGDNEGHLPIGIAPGDVHISADHYRFSDDDKDI